MSGVLKYKTGINDEFIELISLKNSMKYTHNDITRFLHFCFEPLNKHIFISWFLVIYANKKRFLQKKDNVLNPRTKLLYQFEELDIDQEPRVKCCTTKKYMSVLSKVYKVQCSSSCLLLSIKISQCMMFHFKPSE